MNKFFVGQRVVCVDDTGLPAHVQRIKAGSVYTIREIEPDVIPGTIGIRLEEITLGIHPVFGCEEGYRSRRFKPLESKAIELFRKIARDVTEGKKVEIEV